MLPCHVWVTVSLPVPRERHHGGPGRDRHQQGGPRLEAYSPPRVKGGHTSLSVLAPCRERRLEIKERSCEGKT